jgi:hypothetical protein
MFGIVRIASIAAGVAVTHRAGAKPCSPDLKGTLIGLLLIGGLVMLGVELGPVAQAANL